MSKIKSVLFVLWLALFVLGVLPAQAASVTCAYTYTGSEGNYLLDFLITNDIPAEYNQHIGMFAVDLPFDSAAGGPLTKYWFHAPEGAVVNNSAQGGSNIDYTNSWVGAKSYSFSTGRLTPIFDIPSGESLSGFRVHVAQIPDVIHFAAFASDALYIENGGAGPVVHGGPGYFGSDAFLKGHETGFEGIAGKPVVTPEPASLLLFGIGGGVLALRRKVQGGRVRS